MSLSRAAHATRRDARWVKSWLKAFVVVAVTLPIAAYVVGHPRRVPCAADASVTGRPPGPDRRSRLPNSRSRPGPSRRDDDRDDDAGDDDGGPGDDRTEGDDVSVVTPSPEAGRR